MGSMIWPTVCKTITQGYGNKNAAYVKGYHTGLDIGCISGSPIRAAHDGKISSAGWAGAYGNQVKIAATGGLETWYNHLSKISATVGASVSQGTVIGYEGSTGNSTGPHLHFEVRVNGKDVDPMKYLTGSGVIPAGDATQTGVGSALSLPGSLIKAFEWMTEPINWLRIVMVFSGGILLLIALIGLAKTKAMGSLASGTVKKVVKNAVPGRDGTK